MYTYIEIHSKLDVFFKVKEQVKEYEETAAQYSCTNGDHRNDAG